MVTKSSAQWNCPIGCVQGEPFTGSADGYMAKTNGLRLRLRLFGGQKEHQRPLDVSVIAADMRVVGGVHSTSVVSVAGTVLGTLTVDDQVIVTRGGRVQGDVEAREVILDGEVHGSVHARERLEIQASAVVRGDLHAPRLMVHEGAVIDGDVSIAESSPERPSDIVGQIVRPLANEPSRSPPQRQRKRKPVAHGHP